MTSVREQPTTQNLARSHNRVWAVLRLAAAGIAVAALGTQLGYEIQKASAHAEPYARHIPTVIGDFWTTFTYLSTAVMAAVLFISGITALRGKAEPQWLSIALLAAAANTVFVGIFFNIALRWTVPDDSIAWINEYVHVVLPLYALLDSTVGAHRNVPIRTMWTTAILGVGWTIATQIRGPLVINRTTGEPGWYPYDFVNPALAPGGTAGAIVISLTLTGCITLIGYLTASLIQWTRIRRREA